MPAIASLLPGITPPVQPLAPVPAGEALFDFASVFGGIGNPAAADGKTLPDASARGSVKAGKQPTPTVLPHQTDAHDEAEMPFATMDVMPSEDEVSDLFAPSSDDIATATPDASPLVFTPILGMTWIVPKTQAAASTRTSAHFPAPADRVEVGLEPATSKAKVLPGERRGPVAMQPETGPRRSPGKRGEPSPTASDQMLAMAPAVPVPATSAAPTPLPTPANARAQSRAAASPEPVGRPTGSAAPVGRVPAPERIEIDAAFTPSSDTTVPAAPLVDRRTVDIDPQSRAAAAPADPTPEAEPRGPQTERSKSRADGTTTASAPLAGLAPFPSDLAIPKLTSVVMPPVQPTPRPGVRQGNVAVSLQAPAPEATQPATTAQPAAAASLRSASVASPPPTSNVVVAASARLPNVMAPERLAAAAATAAATIAGAPAQVASAASTPTPSPVAPASASIAQTPAVTPQPATVADAPKPTERPAPSTVTAQPITATRPAAPDTAALLGARPASTSRTIVATPTIALSADRIDAPAIPLAAPVPATHVDAEITQAPVDTTRHTWPTQMVDRIERLRDAADAVSTSIRVIPDALGAIDVSVKRDGEVTHVHLAADQSQTRALLAEAAPKLAELAEQRGIKLGQSEVGGGSASTGGQQSAPQQQAARQPTAPVRAAQTERSNPDDSRIA